jgi:UDP-N-acetylmuramoyl-L-alanyl-D-glutamate--2,6-diaminopimelate ligase
MKKFTDLLPGTTAPDLKVGGLHYDSRKIEPGFAFFAVPGFRENGAKYLAPAFRQGAAVAVVQKGTQVPEELRDHCVEVEDVRRALAEAAAAFYDFPARKLALFGVTGTKGKTSTSFLMEAVLREAGRKTALVGGVQCWHPGARFESKLTTLESLDLQKFLAEAVEAGAEAAVMEVSSHALSLDRVWGLQFQGLVFTNLYEDHLDFYKTLERYFAAKRILFREPYRTGQTVAVSNLDNEYGVRLVQECPGNWKTFGKNNGDYRIGKAEFSESGIRLELETNAHGKIEIQSRLFGAFNVHNVAGVAVMALALGFPVATVQAGIASLPAVPGRVEKVPTSLPFAVFVDYAHMGPALENVLSSLRPFCKGKLTVVVGAGGDRPVERRAGLGSAAAKLADFTVITSDNPRTEDPQAILAAVEKAFVGAGGKNYKIEGDRKAAIRFALENAKPGDIICIAGKGHESGQTIGKQTFPFDDRVEATAVLRELEK